MTPTEFARKCLEVRAALAEAGVVHSGIPPATAAIYVTAYFLLSKDQPHADSRPAGYEDRCPDCGYCQSEEYLRTINPPGYDVSKIPMHSYNCPRRT